MFLLCWSITDTIHHVHSGTYQNTNTTVICQIRPGGAHHLYANPTSWVVKWFGMVKGHVDRWSEYSTIYPGCRVCIAWNNFHQYAYFFGWLPYITHTISQASYLTDWTGENILYATVCPSFVNKCSDSQFLRCDRNQFVKMLG